MTADTNVSRLSDFGKANNGWKYYNQIKKKAMEQEFSWAGLLLSLSIAFFIVIITAYSLNLLLASYKNTRQDLKINQQIYQLEIANPNRSENYLQIKQLDLNKIDKNNYAYLRLT